MPRRVPNRLATAQTSPWPTVYTAGVSALAEQIWSPGRTRPLVVLSPVPARRHPWIYVDRAYPERAAQTIVAFLRSELVTVWSSSHRQRPIPSDPLVEIQADLAAARVRISFLTAERKRLLRDLVDLRSCADYRPIPPAVLGDPAAQFRYEIEQHWLHTMSEKERNRCPLARYDIGPDFLGSLETLQVVGRKVVLAAVVDVLTGQASAKNGRRVHRQRVGRGGATAPLVRADGATGWRCDIRSKTPAAPRLLWWALPDGLIESAWGRRPWRSRDGLKVLARI